MSAALSISAPRERPVLFSGPMVRAILAGTKTLTRRLFFSTPSPCAGGPTVYARGYPKDLHPYEGDISDNGLPCATSRVSGCLVDIPSPFGAPGDRLWVRETWAPWTDHIEENDAQAVADAKAQMPWACIVYRASANGGHVNVKRWRPSIFLPRWASRITLEITDVRVERLREITDDDIRAEGVDRVAVAALLGTPVSAETPLRDLWRLGWDAINGKKAPWSAEVFVWRIAFRRLP